MKRGKYLLVVLLAGVVACTNDNLVPDGNGGLPTGGKELENIIFNVPDLEFDGPQTRGYYKVSDTSLGYQWTFGDTIGIFSSKGSQVAFPLASSSGTNTAIFDGKGWGMKVGETYQAYFPYSYFIIIVTWVESNMIIQNRLSLLWIPLLGVRILFMVILQQ